MLCEQCRKREATVKYVEVAGGVKTEHNLCAQCESRFAGVVCPVCGTT